MNHGLTGMVRSADRQEVQTKRVCKRNELQLPITAAFSGYLTPHIHGGRRVLVCFYKRSLWHCSGSPWLLGPVSLWSAICMTFRAEPEQHARRRRRAAQAQLLSFSVVDSLKAKPHFKGHDLKWKNTHWEFWRLREKFCIFSKNKVWWQFWVLCIEYYVPWGKKEGTQLLSCWLRNSCLENTDDKCNFHLFRAAMMS